MRTVSRLLAGLVMIAVVVTACGGDATTSARGVAIPGASGSSATAAGSHFDPSSWHAPDTAAIPTDSFGTAARRGLALVLHTTDSLPRYAPGKITCANCHLDVGRNPDAAPFAGAAARFPKYMERTGAVIALADRVNYCFTRSLAGSRIPTDSREMEDILAYIAWLSRDVPIGQGTKLPGAAGIAPMTEKLTGDTTRGAEVFRTRCTACHAADGQGNPGFPALWGPRSFSVGASMARRDKAASFIWHNMPFGQGRSLTPQQAFDVAAYIDSKPRPDSPGKEGDWPAGDAPADVPYATRGHAAYLSPPLIPRGTPQEALVPKPASVRASSTRR